MKILNYSTSISVDKTFGEIQGLLCRSGARQILTEFDDGGVLSSISFRIETKLGLLTFRLPAKIENIHVMLTKASISKGFKTREQAARVAWRIIKDWIAAQLALVQAEQVTIDQVFLPYMQDSSGKTIYEAVCDRELQKWMPAIEDRRVNE